MSIKSSHKGSSLHWLVGLSATGLLFLVVVSPLLLRAADSVFPGDWAGLSAVGDSYSAVASVLSSFALIGVAASLAIGYRQVRISQQEFARSMQIDLIKMAMADADLAAVLPLASARDDGLAWKQDVFRNLWFMYLSTGFAIQTLAIAEVRHHVAAFFADPATREWWRGARTSYIVMADARQGRIFASVVDHELNRILSIQSAAHDETPQVDRG